MKMLFHFKRYESQLDEARKIGIKKNLVVGLAYGCLWFIMSGSYGLGFWYGFELTNGSGYSVGDITIIFCEIVTAIFSLGSIAPFFSTLTFARVAAYKVFGIINKV